MRNTKKLSELARINPGRPSLSLAGTDEVSFIGMSDVSDNGQWVNRQVRPYKEVKQGYTYFQEGDVLFAKITPCMENGKGCHARGVLNGIGFGSTEFHVLRALPNADARFVFYLTTDKKLRLRAEARMTGSAGQQRVPTEFLENYPVLDFELHEQGVIADILTTIDDAIAHTEALIAKHKRIRAGLMQDLLTKGIDENGVIRSEETHQFKDSPLGRIPVEWEIQAIGNILKSAIDGPFGSNLKSEHYVKGQGVRVIRLQNIGNGRFENSDSAYISLEHAQKLNRHEVIGGDLLVAALGDIKHPIGRACLYPLNYPTAINKADCFRIRVQSDSAHEAYLMYVLNCPTTRDDIAPLGQGVTRNRINLKTFKSIRLRIPSIQEQKHISNMLALIDQEGLQEESFRAKLQRIKTGLMQDLLTGTVRVDALLAEAQL